MISSPGKAFDPTSTPPEERDILGIIGGYKLIASPSVTPVGNALWFPKYGVIVIGAGLGVDVAPEREPSLDELRVQAAALEAAANAAPKADVDKERADLKAKIAALTAKTEAPATTVNGAPATEDKAAAPAKKVTVP